MQPPQCLPKRFKSTNAPSGSKYPFVLKIRNKHQADKCIALLTENGSIFSTKIHERKGAFNWLIHNKDKSFSFRIFWWIVVLVTTYYAYKYIHGFMQTDTWDELKDSVNEVINV